VNTEFGKSELNGKKLILQLFTIIHNDFLRKLKNVSNF